MNDAVQNQRELFALLDEIFQKATGKAPKAFAPLDGFNAAVRSSLPSRANEAQSALNWGIPKLYELYSRQRTSLFAAAGTQGGLKVVLGGSSRFGETQLNAVRRLILYADTVLIPDPVFAWIETPRPEERFPHVQLLEAMFFLLRLKPLVDCASAYPPVIVFPSFERTIAQQDTATQAEMQQFYLDVYSPLLGQRFSSVGQIVEYSVIEEQAFLDAVTRKQLFVAPGGPLDEPLDAAIERYLGEIRTYRSVEHVAELEGMPKGQLVGVATMERLEPQFHLMQNATELKAQPLLAIEQQAYYFKLLASLKEDVLEGQQIISADTRATIDALSHKDLAWLSNVGIDALAEMRMNNENESFRERLSKTTSLLAGADLGDMDRVTAEVTRSIGSMVNEHRQEALKIEAKYQPKYSGMAVKGWLSVGAVLIPHLAPLVSVVAPAWLAGHYAQTKAEERREKRTLAKSLLGIVATAKNSLDSID
jgi:hypothetical protein